MGGWARVGGWDNPDEFFCQLVATYEKAFADAGPHSQVDSKVSAVVALLETLSRHPIAEYVALRGAFGF